MIDARALSVTGEIFADYYRALHSDQTNWPLQISQSLWLRTETETNDSGYKFFGSGSLTLITTSDIPGLDHQRTLGKLHEGYLHYSEGTFQISFGRKTILWGRADNINPTDYLTGNDSTLLNPEGNFTQTSGAGVEVVWRPSRVRLVCAKKEAGECAVYKEMEKNSSWALTGVWLPYFAESQMLTEFTPLPTGVTLHEPDSQTLAVKDWEYAFKASYTGRQWDFSMSLYKGHNRQPLFIEKSRTLVGLTPVVDVQQKYVSNTALGMDGTYNFRGLVVSAESALIVTDNANAESVLTPPTHLDTVIGLDYEPIDNFHVIVQGISFYYPKFRRFESESDPVRRALGEANALISRSQKPNQYGNSVHILYDDVETKHKVDLLFVKFYDPADGYFQPKYTYRWSDVFNFTLGADSYFGPDNSQLGSLRDLSSVFIEVKYFF